VEELCGKLDAKSLGYKFRHFKRRNFGGRMLDRAGEDKVKGNRWSVYPAKANAHRARSSPASPPSPATRCEQAGGDAGDGGDAQARKEFSHAAPRDLYADQMLPD
jgi:hypothetical protein